MTGTHTQANMQQTHSRPVLVAAVEHQEGVRLAEEVLLVQLVGTQLHGGDVLRTRGRAGRW